MEGRLRSWQKQSGKVETLNNRFKQFNDKFIHDRTDIIEAEQRVSSAGLGSKNASYGAGPGGDDYKSYIKKMMKKRYEEVN